MCLCIVIVFQYISNKMQRYTVYFIWNLFYMFWVVSPTIIRSVNNCIYSIWYLSHSYCYLLLSWKSWNRFQQKYAEQFLDKINCVMLHLIEYIYIYIYILE